MLSKEYKNLFNNFYNLAILAYNNMPDCIIFEGVKLSDIVMWGKSHNFISHNNKAFKASDFIDAYEKLYSYCMDNMTEDEENDFSLNYPFKWSFDEYLLQF